MQIHSNRYKNLGKIGALLLLCATVYVRCYWPTAYDASTTEYVGMSACRSCHEDIYDSYIQTGMGHSLYLADTHHIIENFGPNLYVYDPFSDYYYLPYWSGNEMYVKEFRLLGEDTIYVRDERVDYIVGSGNQTRSYFLQRAGYLYEFPITWYVQQQIWDLSPGYGNGNNARFDREIGTECLYCHTDQFTYIEGSKNKYQQIDLGIGCERCHGPGEAHVSLAENRTISGRNTQIINPDDLPLEEQFDVCQQCHLQGIIVTQSGKKLTDFRPGMHLSEVYDVFVVQDSNQHAFGIASHAARLQQSQCFIQSKGTLTCISCHDPHRSLKLSEKNVYLRQCQQCHQEEKANLCTAPMLTQELEKGNCINCHMPAAGTSDIPHVSFHDHNIRVIRQDSVNNLAEQQAFLKLLSATNEHPKKADWAKAWLGYYEQLAATPENLSKAEQYLSAENIYEKANIRFYQGKYEEALGLIIAAMQQAPEDAERQFRKGEILEAMGKFEQAFHSYEQIYRKHPENIEAGLKSGINLLKSRVGDPRALAEARSLFEQLLHKKSFDARILTNLGFIALNQGELKRAEAYLVQALALNPEHAQALENMIYLQGQKGNQRQAKRYLDLLSEKHPEYARLGELRRGIKAGVPNK